MILPQGGRGPVGQIRDVPGIAPRLESQLPLILSQGTPEGIELPSITRKHVALRDIFCFEKYKRLNRSQKKQNR